MSANGEKIQLTEADCAILRLLQTDATATLEDIAAAANLSTASAWRRVKSLEATGVIVSRVALLDAHRAGWGLCAFADVSLKDHSAGNRRSFERFVATADEVMECHSLAGVRDYLLKIRAPDISAFEAFLMERLLAHPAVASASSSFSLRELKYTTGIAVNPSA
ncbi:MAG: Lrp/AsnC family transcriptional regulator [Pseudomonadota bacterium]